MIQRYNNPTAIVIFGGTGNLAETKLLPALFRLYSNKMLPQEFLIVGLSRKVFSHSEYQSYVHDIILAKNTNADKQELKKFCECLRFSSGNFNDDLAYEKVKDELLAFDKSIGQCSSKLFYLAVPPDLYGEIFEKLKQSNAMNTCNDVSSWSRILVEKPFGSNLATAKRLEEQLCELFTEDQIYRIDHYLAKDSIENIVALRFANSILADSWNDERIESIALRLFETNDVSSRGSFYDGIGALRDVGQNHMLQMLALLTMCPADVDDAEAVRESRLMAVRSLVVREQDVLLRAQYEGYKETKGVSENSETETYFKIGTHIDNDLWKRVEVTLESGKALNDSFTEAVITFRPIDKCNCASEEGEHEHRNILRITFSPSQSISLTMWVKEPGFEFKLHERKLELASHKGEEFRSPEAYERVLYDCVVGDQARFVSGEEVAAAWSFITPILSSFKEIPLHEYKKGSSEPINSVK